MSTRDGRVIGLQPVVVNGPTDFLLNFVVVAEGFQEGDLPMFEQYVERFADKLFSTAPFNEARCGINVFRVDVASTDTGADDPLRCMGTGKSAATYFDASFCADGVARGLSVDEGSVINVVRGFVPQWHFIIVLVNSQKLGGTGGQPAKCSVTPGWENIAIHEMGHSLFGLADEYEYLQGCGQESDRNEFPHFLGIRIEPVEPNITIWTDRKGLKWRDLVKPETPIPTTNNADCKNCDPQPSPEPAGTVGTFEGAGTYHCKVYRPEFDCKMRNNARSFCAVCTRTIRVTTDGYHRFAAYYAPLRIKSIDKFAELNGFAGGFPNFYDADYGAGIVFGSILLKPGAADRQDVSVAELGNPSDFEQRFRAVHDYAVANGYVGGYPNFHEADSGHGIVYGCILIRAGSADWRDVSAAELGHPRGIPPGNVAFIAVNDYAVANGYVGGYPNFHQADYGHGVVYGCILIKPSEGEWRDVPIKDLCVRPRRLNDAVFVSQSVRLVMQRGQSQLVTVTMRNNGTATWTRAASYRLGSQAPQDNSLWGSNRVDLPTAAVSPGATARFQFPLIAPRTPGTYSFQWRMLQEMVEWFGDFTPVEVKIHVLMTLVSHVAVAPLSNGALEIWATDAAGGLVTTWKMTSDPGAAWAPWWSDFLAEVGGLAGGVRQVAVAPLSNGALELWATDAAGGLFTTWKTTAHPAADWTLWSDFLAEVGGLAGGVRQIAVAPLSNGALSLWATDAAGGLFNTWKISSDPAADWTLWSDFLAEVGGLAGGVRQIAVAPLSNGALSLWATDAGGGLFNTWKMSSDPAADWTLWSDFLAEGGGLPGRLPGGVRQIAVAPLSNGALSLWATDAAGGLFNTWKMSSDPAADWTLWSDFLAEGGGLPGGVRQIAVAPLSNGALQLWATDAAGGVFTTWKMTSDPAADWTLWSDFLAEV